MNKTDKLKAKILAGQGYHNISFGEVTVLLKHLGFSSRQNGSHHFFSHPNIPEPINIQSAKGQCKPYQLRQIRDIIRDHKL